MCVTGHEAAAQRRICAKPSADPEKARTPVGSALILLLNLDIMTEAFAEFSGRRDFFLINNKMRVIERILGTCRKV